MHLIAQRVLFITICLLFTTEFVGCGSAPVAYPSLGPGRRVVGVPPADAGAGLIRISETEIRHYNLNRHNNHEHDGDLPFGYIVSLDNGQTWSTSLTPGPEAIAEARHLSQDPRTGTYYALASGGKWIAQATTLEGPWQITPIDYFKENWGIIHEIVYPTGSNRLLFAVHDVTNGTYTMASDDDGQTWTRSNFITTPAHEIGGVHEGVRWNHNAAEPQIVELARGRLWMMIRCAQDFHYQSFSDDAGLTWSQARPSRFHGTITMPNTHRLDDGRLVIVWNNTAPLPELESATGWPEDVFTNREAIHIAISDDDGRTWRGFRELYLDEHRNRSDWATPRGSDRGTQQSQIIDLRDNTILVALGQHSLHRKMLIVDLDWVTTYARNAFFIDEDGEWTLQNWSTHQYIAGICGHCAYNRKPGAQLEDHPDMPGRPVLRVARPDDPELICENQGAVWNFASFPYGWFIMSLMVPEGSQGIQVNLLDRWFNPTDLTAEQFAMATLDIEGDGTITGTGLKATPGEWFRIYFLWQENPTQCQLLYMAKDKILGVNLLDVQSSPNGISYLQFISRAETTDNHGVLIDYIRANYDHHWD